MSVDPLRADAERRLRRYVAARQAGASPAGARLAVAESEGVSLATAGAWERAGHWEHMVRRLEYEVAAEKRPSAGSRLGELRQRWNDIGDMMRVLADRANLTLALDAMAEYRQLAHERDNLYAQIEQVETSAATRYGETASLPSKLQRREIILAQLKQQYAGLGPQYDLLAERAASALLYIENLEDSGAPISPSDWQKAHRVFFDNIAQLQQYTESTKTEVLVRDATQRAMERVIFFFERELAPQIPEAWENALLKLEAEVDATQGTVIEHTTNGAAVLAS